MTDKQNNTELITSDMLSWPIDEIVKSLAMKTRENDKDGYEPFKATLNINFAGATLEDVLNWATYDRRIAAQRVLRKAGQEFIESHPVVDVIARDAAKQIANITANDYLQACYAKGMTYDEAVAGLTK